MRTRTTLSDQDQDPAHKTKTELTVSWQH